MPEPLRSGRYTSIELQNWEQIGKRANTRRPPKAGLPGSWAGSLANMRTELSVIVGPSGSPSFKVRCWLAGLQFPLVSLLAGRIPSNQSTTTDTDFWSHAVTCCRSSTAPPALTTHPGTVPSHINTLIFCAIKSPLRKVSNPAPSIPSQGALGGYLRFASLTPPVLTHHEPPLVSADRLHSSATKKYQTFALPASILPYQSSLLLASRTVASRPGFEVFCSTSSFISPRGRCSASLEYLNPASAHET